MRYGTGILGNFSVTHTAVHKNSFLKNRWQHGGDNSEIPVDRVTTVCTVSTVFKAICSGSKATTRYKQLLFEISKQQKSKRGLYSHRFELTANSINGSWYTHIHKSDTQRYLCSGSHQLEKIIYVRCRMNLLMITVVAQVSNTLHIFPGTILSMSFHHLFIFLKKWNELSVRYCSGTH